MGGLILGSSLIFSSCLSNVASIAQNMQGLSGGNTGTSNPLQTALSAQQKLQKLQEVFSEATMEKLKNYKCMSVHVNLGSDLLNGPATSMLTKVIEGAISKYKETEKGKDMDLKVCTEDKCECSPEELVVVEYQKAILPNMNLNTQTTATNGQNVNPNAERIKIINGLGKVILDMNI
jgi:hypothetical protein